MLPSKFLVPRINGLSDVFNKKKIKTIAMDDSFVKFKTHSLHFLTFFSSIFGCAARHGGS